MPQYCKYNKDGETCKTRANYGDPETRKVMYCKKHSLEVTKDTGETKMIMINSNLCIGKLEDGSPCLIQPSFNFRGVKAKYCIKHKQDGMVNLTIKLCSEEGCKENGIYNRIGDKSKYCEKHKEDEMINSTKKYCSLYPKCKIGASYALPDKSGKWFCSTHSDKKTMICHSANYCQDSKCKPKQACYNYPGIKPPIFCSTHAKPNMVNITYTGCAYKNDPCYRFPMFNFIGNKKGIYCAKHCEDNMINVISSRCQHILCKTQPSFNYPEDSKPILCSKHKKPNMINVIAKICQNDNCHIQAGFNYEGHIPIYCTKHKKDDMICVVKAQCLYIGCNIRPSFNYKGETTPLYCATHVINKDMVNIKTDKCKMCDKSPHYNFFNETKGIYCYTHKEKNMVDIKNRRCVVSGCSGDKNNLVVPKIALYDFYGSKIPKYCKEHKEAKMINILNTSCELPLCKLNAIYNVPGSIGRFCGRHKKSGMVLFPYRKCQTDFCDDYATHGLTEQIAEYCEAHSPKDYFSIINFTCHGCNMIDIVDDDGFCITCNPNSRKQIRLAKQRRVVAWLNQSNQFKNYKSIDSVPDELYECDDKYRPDIFYDMGDRYVILEVDENQHNYDTYKNCDLPRMINIQQALALPTIFIRYNPDPYKRKGVTQKTDNDSRKKILFQWINDAKTCDLGKDQLRTVYLYYDEFLKSDVKYNIIDIFDVAKKLTS